MYGCPQHFYRGACANDLRVRQRCLEERLLCDLQEALLRPGAIDYTLEEFSRQVEAVRTETS